MRKATFIVRLWAEGKLDDDDEWHGSAELIGRGQSCTFETLTELFDWLRYELAKTTDSPG